MQCQQVTACCFHLSVLMKRLPASLPWLVTWSVRWTYPEYTYAVPTRSCLLPVSGRLCCRPAWKCVLCVRGARKRVPAICAPLCWRQPWKSVHVSMCIVLTRGCLLLPPVCIDQETACFSALAGDLVCPLNLPWIYLCSANKKLPAACFRRLWWRPPWKSVRIGMCAVPARGCLLLPHVCVDDRRGTLSASVSLQCLQEPACCFRRLC